jgi:hypothetical protein
MIGDKLLHVKLVSTLCSLSNKASVPMLTLVLVGGTMHGSGCTCPPCDKSSAGLSSKRLLNLYTRSSFLIFTYPRHCPSLVVMLGAPHHYTCRPGCWQNYGLKKPYVGLSLHLFPINCPCFATDTMGAMRISRSSFCPPTASYDAECQGKPDST